MGGGTEQLIPVTKAADIDAGYYLAWERIVDDWAKNKARWHDA